MDRRSARCTRDYRQCSWLLGLSRRKSPQTVTTSPSPTESPVVQATPSLINEKAGQTATPENKAAAATQARSEQPKHTSKQTENATAKPTPASDSLNRDLLRHRSPPPTDQYVPPPDTPRPRPQEPRVQTFPNGTRMERRPDGTMVITFPNGATRVIPPGMPPPTVADRVRIARRSSEYAPFMPNSFKRTLRG
jgi:hypothetical protein